MSDEKKRYVSVSTEPVPIEDMIKYFEEIEWAGADLLHCDVMDGLVTEHATYDNVLLKGIRKSTRLPLDVHIMINEPFKNFKPYLKLKPCILTVQYEHFNYEKQLRKVLKKIRRKRVKSGLAVSPNIPISYLLPFIPYIDVLLIMGVNIGTSGQTMNDDCIRKVREASMLRDKFRKKMLIEVDGGVNYDNVESLYSAGADIVVSGSLVYNAFSKKYAIDNLRWPAKIIVK